MRTLRFNFPTHCTCLVTGRSRDDQAAGKHLSLRKYRAGQRIEASVPAHGTRYLGSHWRGLHEAFRLSPVSIQGRVWEAIAFPSTPFILSWKAKEWDFRTRFIELAGEINTAMPYHVLASVGEALNRHKKAVNGVTSSGSRRRLQERYR